VELGEPDRYGKRTQEFVISGRFGETRLRVRPQWAILSDSYHGRSLATARERLKTAVKYYSERDPARPPTLWVLEVPGEIHVRFGSWRDPFFLAKKKSETFAAWIGDWVDQVYQGVSWEAFVERL
jgi:hypothetical protein